MSNTAIQDAGLAQPLLIRDESGLGPAASEDERLLDQAVGPVLAVGCGPGRYLLALARLVEATGIDLSAAAVRSARFRGASVWRGRSSGRFWRREPGLRRSFSTAISASAATRWRCSPGWRRFCAAGRILVELEDRGPGSGAVLARIEHDAGVGPWFQGSTVDTAAIGIIAARAGLRVMASWSGRDRRFPQLDLCARLLP